jgi:hypothetical protein
MGKTIGTTGVKAGDIDLFFFYHPAEEEMLAKEDISAPIKWNGINSYYYSQDELRRLFQESGKLYADEMVFKSAITSRSLSSMIVWKSSIQVNSPIT